MNSFLDRFKPILNDYEPNESKAPKASYVGRLREIQATIENKACQEIRFAQPLLTLDGVGIVFPNTLTVIQGQKGVHKSRLTENLCAAFVKMDVNREFIGFKIAPLKRFHVVYGDTERNLNDQFPFAIQRIKALAGFDKTERPSNLEAFSLIEIDRAERFEAVKQYLDDVREKHANEHIVVVLDVITDCIGSFNDPKESMKLLDHLNMTINQHNVSFICVIHENPNSFGEAKARGHLGTELINKASTVISIGFDKGANGVTTDLIALKFLHTRNTKKPEPHYVRYSEEAKGLVVADANFIAEQKSLKAEKAELGELKDWLLENMTGEISKTELVGQLTEYFGCTSKTIETRLKSLTEGDSPFLARHKQGKEVIFTLVAPF